MKSGYLRISCLLSLVSCLLFFGLLGCTTAQKGAGIGAGLGAGTGAIIGHQSGNTGKGALIGGAVGGLAGALIGEQMDTKYCPVCGRGYTSGTTYCSVDGTPLKTKGEGTVPQAQQAPSAAEHKHETQKTMFCPTCGIQYSSDYAYCTKDGAKLTPIK